MSSSTLPPLLLTSKNQQSSNDLQKIISSPFTLLGDDRIHLPSFSRQLPADLEPTPLPKPFMMEKSSGTSSTLLNLFDDDDTILTRTTPATTSSRRSSSQQHLSINPLDQSLVSLDTDDFLDYIISL